MRILFDTGVPRALAKSLSPHEVSTTQKQGWKDLRNGDLLRVAQETFDVLLTTDSNIKFQQQIEQFDIALIVLRAVKTSKDRLLPLMSDVLTTLTTIKPGECVYLYADESLRNRDIRKGQPKENLDDFSVNITGVTFLYDFGFPHVVKALEPSGRYFFSYEGLKQYIKRDGLLGVFIR
ncbi:MAG: hypothetical protein L0Y75_06490 [Acidobacteria bacterium]|nr:hypothetical protein [Acidobacteriota bacterium]